MYDRKFLKNAKGVVNSDEFSNGGILERAKEAAIPKKGAIDDMMIASRSKKRSRGVKR